MTNPSTTTSSATSDTGIAEGLRRGVLAGLAVLVIAIPPGNQRSVDGNTATSARAPTFSHRPLAFAAADARHQPRVADFGADTASTDARQLVNWVADSRDNAGTGFVVVDKKAARVYVFDAEARLRGSTPVLLGSARGDDSVPGIGTRPIPDIRPEERTTPAGRFVGQIGRNAIGEDIVWVDYGAAISMHRVRTTNKKEHRLERLASPSIDDNRISYGCINMPVAFYEGFIQPTFARQRVPIYVLPDQKSLQQVFGLYDVAGAARQQSGAATLLGTAGRGAEAAALPAAPAIAMAPS